MMEVRRASESEREVIANLMQCYLHDLSEFTGQRTDLTGKFALGPYFGLYWTEPHRYPYLLLLHGEPAGFALVRRTEPGAYCVAEFFLLKTYRGKGIGSAFAAKLFDEFSGTWSVAQLEENVPAQKFWRTVIADYTRGDYHEGRSFECPYGPMQTFIRA